MRARTKSILVLSCAMTATAIVTGVATRYVLERPAYGDRVAQGALASRALDEDREYLVYLPESYGDGADQRYPVLYALDGSSQAGHTARSAALMARLGLMPEVIVVGIPNVSRRGRARDYTPPEMRQDVDVPDSPPGQADRFLGFLRDELIPAIERDYRVAAPRMLAGNSRGGLFVVYSQIVAPDLFDARFAYSAPVWREEAQLVQRLEALLETGSPLRGDLFLSVGDRETDRMKAGFERAAAALEKRAPATLRWRAELTSRADHGDNAPLSTPVGLRHVFSGWAPTASRLEARVVRDKAR
jgi:predicted alpha/beta superfamily hydrolase